MVRFLHTADWQLGMTRRYLGAEAQARFTQARLDAVARLGEVARARDCAFVAVAGDAFDSNLVDRQVLLRALQALAAVRLPVLLLPGNHDAFDAASLYRSPTFLQQRPPNVHVLAGEASTFRGVPGVEVVGAPWPSRKPARDLVEAALAGLDPPTGLRVLVAHGRTDDFRPARREAASIRMAVLERGLARGLVHYVALGDRHSFSAVGDSGRAFYAGAPEPTDFDEDRPGCVLVVDLDPAAAGAAGAKPRVEPVPIATWRFASLARVLASAADVADLARTLAGFEDKERTVLRLDLSGTLEPAAWLALEACLDENGDLFAGLHGAEGRVELAAGAADLCAGLSGWPADAARGLAARAAHDAAARDALVLLHRLTREQEAS